MAGRKNVWDTTIKPNLGKIKQMLGDGITEKECARVIGISYGAWNKYKAIKPEFVQMIQQFRQPAVAEVESAMYKSACGFERKVRKAMKVKRTEYENGRKVLEQEEVVFYDEVEYFKPDTTAGIFLLTNWAKGDYARDAAALEVRKKELELKEKQQW